MTDRPEDIIFEQICGVDCQVVEYAHRALGQALERLAAAGFVIVPAVPSDEMITAGLIPTAAWQNIEGSAMTVNREKMRLRYMAMIAAANDKVPA